MLKRLRDFVNNSTKINVETVADHASSTTSRTKRKQCGFYSMAMEAPLPHVLRTDCTEDELTLRRRLFIDWFTDNEIKIHSEWSFDYIMDDKYKTHGVFSFRDEDIAMAFKIAFSEDLKLS